MVLLIVSRQGVKIPKLMKYDSVGTFAIQTMTFSVEQDTVGKYVCGNILSLQRSLNVYIRRMLNPLPDVDEYARRDIQYLLPSFPSFLRQ